ncbi:hypothetical protein [Vibrio hyugaensis]|uniref:hypothetical protein n=1 Tax=Vibrio hyugaensis TaxID=1534743 RepID=UPI0005EDB9F4|nr:hypothetical protein [Vibrio hyugaensis]
MSSAATPLPSATPPSKQQVLLQGLEKTGEQAFARIVATSYGFRVSNRWDRTAKNVAEDIKSTDSKHLNCTVDNLEKLVDRVIISANHHYTIYKLSQLDAVQVRQALTAYIGQTPTNLYAKTYPDLVDFSTMASTTAGHYLCKVVDMGDGIACIFASVVKEPLSGYRPSAATMITSQYFHTVFVPHNADRIEVRVSDNAPARYHENHATAINNEFINIVGAQGVRFTATLINFFKCISSYFSDATSGRIAHAVLTTGQDSKDAELKNLRCRNYCARTQQVVDTQNNFTYVCRGILIRKPHSGNTPSEVEISFFPHKNTWESNSCWSLQIKKPQTSVALNLIITDAIARS